MATNGEIRISLVQDEAGLEKFLRFPWRIYQQDPYWVPPLLPEQRRFLDRRQGPFFEIGEAQYFLAFRDGEPVGRISAHINRLHDDHYGPGTGFWGFFEAVPDQQVAQALFEAAAGWLRERGCNRLVGPLSFSIYDEMGLLVEGFDSIPAIFQTHNPPYYLDLVTSWGFRKAMDWVALKLTDLRSADLPAMERRLEEILDSQKVTLAPYNSRELARRAEEVYQLFNEAWSVNWGHVPLTRRQFDHLLHEVKPLLRPGLATMLLDGDNLVGFGIVLPDLNPLVQKLNGRFNLWDKLRLLYAAKFGPVHKVRALVIGIAQPYQLKKLNYAIFLKIYLYLARHSCDFVDFSLIPENLRHWIKVIQSFGGQQYKTFRVFEREI